jgi:hypothetical protein
MRMCRVEVDLGAGSDLKCWWRYCIGRETILESGKRNNEGVAVSVVKLYNMDGALCLGTARSVRFQVV